MSVFFVHHDYHENDHGDHADHELEDENDHDNIRLFLILFSEEDDEVFFYEGEPGLPRDLHLHQVQREGAQ